MPQTQLQREAAVSASSTVRNSVTYSSSSSSCKNKRFGGGRVGLGVVSFVVHNIVTSNANYTTGGVFHTYTTGGYTTGGVVYLSLNTRPPLVHHTSRDTANHKTKCVGMVYDPVSYTHLTLPTILLV